MTRRTINGATLVWLCILAHPIGVAVCSTFWEPDHIGGSHLSLRPWYTLWQKDLHTSILWTGAVSVLASVVLSLHASVTAAYCRVATSRVRFILLLVVLIPVFTSALLRSFAAESLMGYGSAARTGALGCVLGWVGAAVHSKWSLLFGYMLVYYPFAVVAFWLDAAEVSESEIRAALDMGCTRAHAARALVWNALCDRMPRAIILFSALLAVDLLVPKIFAGGKWLVGGALLEFIHFRLDDSQTAFAVGFALVIVALVCPLVVCQAWRQVTRLQCMRITEARKWLDSKWFAVSWVAGSIMALWGPLVFIIWRSCIDLEVRYDMAVRMESPFVLLMRDSELWDAATTSLGVACTVAVLCSFTAVAIVAQLRYASCITTRVATMTWYSVVVLTIAACMPEIVIGLSSYTVFNRLNVASPLMRLIAAHVLLVMPMAIWIVYYCNLRIPLRYERDAVELGARGMATVWSISRVLLMRAGAMAGVVAFAFSFDDFVVAHFVRPAGTVTLPQYLGSMIRLRRGLAEVYAYTAIVILFLCSAGTAILISWRRRELVDSV